VEAELLGVADLARTRAEAHDLSALGKCAIRDILGFRSTAGRRAIALRSGAMLWGTIANDPGRLRQRFSSRRTARTDGTEADA
jgi:hypothetical protein